MSIRASPVRPGPYASRSMHSPLSGSYVFDNYTWERTPGDFSSYNGKPIPARVPLTALISGMLHFLTHYTLLSLLSNPGPAAGDPFPQSTNAPPAVTPKFFDEVCPNRTVIDCQEINGMLSNASAATILQAWVDKLEQTEDRCVEVKEHSGQIFDLSCVFLSYSPCL
jgi:hypothetical protein